jgi:5'-3' exoribonuclease 1
MLLAWLKLLELVSAFRQLTVFHVVCVQSLKNHPTFGAKFDLERVIDDFVLCCMFVGNDFLPHLPHMDIADGALNMMMSVYKEMLPKMGGYLTKKAEVHLCRLELYLREVSEMTPQEK